MARYTVQKTWGAEALVGADVRNEFAHPTQGIEQALNNVVDIDNGQTQFDVAQTLGRAALNRQGAPFAVPCFFDTGLQPAGPLPGTGGFTVDAGYLPLPVSGTTRFGVYGIEMPTDIAFAANPLQPGDVVTVDFLVAPNGGVTSSIARSILTGAADISGTTYFNIFTPAMPPDLHIDQQSTPSVLPVAIEGSATSARDDRRGLLVRLTFAPFKAAPRAMRLAGAATIYLGRRFS